MVAGWERAERGAMLIVGFLAAVVSSSFAAEQRAVTRGDAEDGCTFYLAAVLAHAEDMYPREFAVWKYNCEHHPEPVRCQEVNTGIAKRRGEARFALKCG